MSRNSPVKGGPPLWLWGMLLVATVTVGVGVLISSAPVDPEELYQAALSQLSERDIDEFDGSVNRLRQFPEYSEHIELLEGIKAAQETRDPKAVEFFERAMKNTELKPLALQKAGDSLTRMGKFREAIGRYEEAVKVAPETADLSRILLARLYHAVGALTLAETTLNSVLESDEANIGAARMRAKVKMALFQYEDAVVDYSATLVAPGDVAAASPEVITNYVRCLLRTKDADRISAFVEKHQDLITDSSLKAALLWQNGDKNGVQAVIAAEPDERPDFTKLQAQIALSNGETEEAEKKLSESLTYKSRDTELYQLAIDVYKAIGDSRKVDVAEQNLRQLEDLQKQLVTALADVGQNIDDVDGRFRVAILYSQIGRFQDAQQWFIIGGVIDPERGNEAQQLMRKHLQRLPPLVKFEEAGSAQTTADEENAGTTPDKAPSDVESQTPPTESTEKDGNESP
ncbi:MAG: tetratricopeptide repeat protein [Fuerstiella sp.]|nr:tetratricopeptide repeat protein [Fuerstiella sp.]